MNERYDAGDEAQVKVKRAEHKIARKLELDDVREVLASPGGRRLMIRLIDVCGLYRPAFSSNGSTTAFNEGQRNVALFLLREAMEADKVLASSLISDQLLTQGISHV